MGTFDRQDSAMVVAKMKISVQHCRLWSMDAMVTTEAVVTFNIELYDGNGFCDDGGGAVVEGHTPALHHG